MPPGSLSTLNSGIIFNTQVSPTFISFGFIVVSALIILSKVNIEELLQDEKDPILLCYEKSNEFCHRHILAEYINFVKLSFLSSRYF